MSILDIFTISPLQRPRGFSQNVSGLYYVRRISGYKIHMCVKLYYLGRAKVFSSVATDFGSWTISWNVDCTTYFTLCRWFFFFYFTSFDSLAYCFVGFSPSPPPLPPPPTTHQKNFFSRFRNVGGHLACGLLFLLDTFRTMPAYIYGCKKRIWFYGPFKNISLISSRSFIIGGQKPEYPEKPHLSDLT